MQSFSIAPFHFEEKITNGKNKFHYPQRTPGEAINASIILLLSVPYRKPAIEIPRLMGHQPTKTAAQTAPVIIEETFK